MTLAVLASCASGSKEGKMYKDFPETRQLVAETLPLDTALFRYPFRVKVQGDKVPMYFMVGCFVVLRQIYLMITIPLTGKLELVFAGWPITWVVCAAGMLFYFVKAKWLPEE